ncbi:hypothetical protein BMS3Abin02_01712 [bacterium BMS3Abin02]|nr:hypothetical protein BMS3Abin02_01712 [bacterium BMS3Abin02]
MHAVLITFQSSVGLDQLDEPFAAYARGLRDVPGLVSKTWIRDQATFGGFHLFVGRAEADSYLSSQMVADLTANRAFSDFEIRHFEVLERQSLQNGMPTVPLAV